MPAKKSTLPVADDLLSILQARFSKHPHRHRGIDWKDVADRLQAAPLKLQSLHAMETTGGEPDVTGYDEQKGVYIFTDCAAETPSGRRSTCYDEEARLSRKEHPPKASALGMAADMGISILNEEDYRALQALEAFDTKTSSWIQTPANIRGLGGALFGDRRFETVFIYHNGASSYYAARGFRGKLEV